MAPVASSPSRSPSSLSLPISTEPSPPTFSDSTSPTQSRSVIPGLPISSPPLSPTLLPPTFSDLDYPPPSCVSRLRLTRCSPLPSSVASSSLDKGILSASPSPPSFHLDFFKSVVDLKFRPPLSPPSSVYCVPDGTHFDSVGKPACDAQTNLVESLLDVNSAGDDSISASACKGNSNCLNQHCCQVGTSPISADSPSGLMNGLAVQEPDSGPGFSVCARVPCQFRSFISDGQSDARIVLPSQPVSISPGSH